MSDEGPHRHSIEDKPTDFSFNGNAGIEDMGRDLLQPVEPEKVPLGAVSPEERRAEAVNIATTLPNADVAQLLSAAYQIEEYLISGRQGARESTDRTD